MENIIDSISVLKRAINAFPILERTRFIDKNIKSMSDITIFPFFGDMRSTFILSSLLLRRIREELKGSKYFILCSWQGFEDLFPYADEYWTIKDEEISKKLFLNSNGFENDSEIFTKLRRNLNYFFEDVIDDGDLYKYYNNGIQQGFIDKFRHIKRFMPVVPSSAILGQEFNKNINNKKGYKIFINPSLFANSWKNGKLLKIKIPKDFWVGLTNRLLNEGFIPVIWKNFTSYDLSFEFIDSCLHVSNKNISSVLGAMRVCDCVLDVFNGVSRWAIMARTPFICLDDRAKFINTKEYELDDLFSLGVPHQYILNFPIGIGNIDKKSLNINFFDGIINKLNEFIPNLNKDIYPSTGEIYEMVRYDSVRKRENKKFGAKFIKFPRL